MKGSFFLIIFLNIIFSSNIFSQSFGVQFNAHEVELDSRTGLDLNPRTYHKINGDFNLEFDLAYDLSQIDLFGYIFRIIGNDTLNLDLISDSDKNTFTLVEGKSGKLIAIPVNIDDFGSFVKVQLKFIKKENLFHITIDNNSYKFKTDAFEKIKKWQFFFGMNESKLFKTTDVPGMKIRNISLHENERKTHEWLLNNKKGSWVKDEIGEIDAYIKNPLWLYNAHNEWRLERELKFSNYAQFAQKENSDTLFFLSNDSLLIYNLSEPNNLLFKALPSKIKVPNGSKIVYNKFNESLIYYSLDDKKYSELNTLTLKTTKKISTKKNLTGYWQHNSILNTKDTSIFFIGGYGFLKYKNEITNLNINSGKWTIHEPDKNILPPHYLAAVGKSKNNDTIYILGGYGSATGDQKINPGYFYNLTRFIPATNNVENVYTLKDPKIEEFCMSGNLVLNNDSTFYALAYSKYEFKNELKLIKGSLFKPGILVDDEVIPFNFHDIMSYVNIVYSPKQEKLYAITSFYNDLGITSVKIHSLLAKPALTPASTYKKEEQKSYKTLLVLIISILIITIIIFLLIRNRSANKQIKTNQTNNNEETTKPVINNIENTPVKENKQPEQKIIPEEIHIPKINYSITFFGGFQVIDKTETNITSKFTPLLKELFLLIFLKSYGENATGISSDKLKEILWFDKSDKDARNNRAVNIARLKSLLAKVGEITISKSTGYWVVEVADKEILIDFSNFLNFTKTNNHSSEQILQLLQILKRGEFLHNVNYEWLDKYKAEVSEGIIDTLLNFASLNNNIDPSLLIQIADAILAFDSVNEEALSIKCKSLINNGKHSIAKKTYDIFTKEYKTLYGEDYSLTFNNIIEN